MMQHRSQGERFVPPTRGRSLAIPALGPRAEPEKGVEPIMRTSGIGAIESTSKTLRRRSNSQGLGIGVSWDFEPQSRSPFHGSFGRSGLLEQCADSDECDEFGGLTAREVSVRVTAHSSH